MSKQLLCEILGGSEYDYFEPKKADGKLSREIFTGARELTKFYGRQLLHAGWRFFGTHQNRGYCFYAAKVITIPGFAIHRSTLYKEWYVCHEMSHAYCAEDGHRDEVHGPRFMEILKIICPQDCIHFELGYKPRNAAAAGIKDPNRPDPASLLDSIL